jgi:hypothetical protein
MTDLFGKSRRLAFEKWQTGTNRQGCGIHENYEKSYECKWQWYARERFDYTHISFFAVWATGLETLLICFLMNDTTTMTLMS